MEKERLPAPQAQNQLTLLAVYNSLDTARDTVSNIIGAGIEYRQIVETGASLVATGCRLQIHGDPEEESIEVVHPIELLAMI